MSRPAAPRTLALPGLLLAISGASCALSFPDYELDEGSSSSSSSSAGGAGGAAPLLPNGAACTSKEECVSGHCLQNNTAPGRICCAIECLDDGPSSCGLNGSCDAGGLDCAMYPAGTECGPTTCEDGTETTEQCLAGSCTPGGAPNPCEGGHGCEEDGLSCKETCDTTEDCANPADETTGAECTMAGDCIERPAGAPCEADADCESNVCGSGRCCQAECLLDGECGATGCDAEGECIYPGEQVACGLESSCASSNIRSLTCDGLGACGRERTQQCPGHLGCENAASCYSSCGSNDATGDARCAQGYWCDGSTCHPASWDEGSTCSRDGQCRSNDCTPQGLCSAADCDFDGDGQLREGAACGGKDCDDNDQRVWYGQPDFFEAPRSRGGYDFNCDGADLGEHPTGCSCAGHALLVPAGEAGCGVTGRIRKCGAFFVVWCVWNDSADEATQRCR